MNEPNKLSEKWPWNKELSRLLLLIPFFSIIGAFLLSPLFGTDSLYFLLGIPGGLLMWGMYAVIGNRVKALKDKYVNSGGQVAECLSQIGNIEAPGIAILDELTLRIVQITGRKGVIPLSDILSVRQGSWMPGKYVFGKRAFILKTISHKRISFAVPESVGRRWSRKMIRISNRRKL